MEWLALFDSDGREGDRRGGDAKAAWESVITILPPPVCLHFFPPLRWNKIKQ